MNKTVGIIGGGQLGQMLALAGIPLNLSFRFLEPNAVDAPCKNLGVFINSQFDTQGVDELANGCDVITFEFENIPTSCFQNLNNIKLLKPNSNSLEITQDRVAEKEFLKSIDIPTTQFLKVDSFSELKDAIEMLGVPCVLKTRRLGYDGRGQLLINESVINQGDECLQSSSNAIISEGAILEKFVKFSEEVSCIGVFSDLESAFYPICKNTHSSGILRHTEVDKQHPLSSAAVKIVDKIAVNLNYRGVITVEFFVFQDNLLVNEIAPRVHNSGHWSIKGSQTSQFENHLRAILNLPLGSTELTTDKVEMWNIIGDIPNLDDLLSLENLQLHLYGKIPKNNRKLGHITLTGEIPESIRAKIIKLVEP